MLNSRIYTRYFPVLNGVTQFSDKEKRTLCRWAKEFRIDVQSMELCKSKRGCVRYQTFDMSHYDENIMLDMINKNCIDSKYLAMLKYYYIQT